MKNITKISILGIDIAKSVFVMVGLDEKGHEILKKNSAAPNSNRLS